MVGDKGNGSETNVARDGLAERKALDKEKIYAQRHEPVVFEDWCQDWN